MTQPARQTGQRVAPYTSAHLSVAPTTRGEALDESISTSRANRELHGRVFGEIGRMAKTNFAALTTEQKTAWGMAFWHHARNNAFISRFLGKGPNSMIQHITELTKGAKGARAVLT